MFRNPVTDVVVVLVVALLIFGPKRLPLLGRSLGQGLREFKDSITGDSKPGDGEERPELTAGTAASPVSPAAATSATPAPADAATVSPADQPARPLVPERESAELGTAERRV
jgi:sec-independent protein translocase protein TatA